MGFNSSHFDESSIPEPNSKFCAREKFSEIFSKIECGLFCDPPQLQPSHKKNFSSLAKNSTLNSGKHNFVQKKSLCSQAFDNFILSKQLLISQTNQEDPVICFQPEYDMSGRV